MKRSFIPDLIRDPRSPIPNSIGDPDEQRRIAVDGEVTFNQILNNWSLILERVHHPVVKRTIAVGTPSRLDKNQLFLTFPTAFHQSKMSEREIKLLFEEVLEKTLNVKLSISAEVEAPASNEAGSEEARDPGSLRLRSGSRMTTSINLAEMFEGEEVEQN